MLPIAYSPADAAAALSVTRSTIYNLINRGQLRAVKIGRSTRIPYSEIERLAGIVPIEGGTDDAA